MIEMRRIYLLVLLMLLQPVFTQESTDEVVSKVATAAANWLKLESGARAIGMGGAHVAAGNGVSSIPYNPASLGFIQGSQLYYSKSNYVADITHSVLSYGTQFTATDYFAIHMFNVDSGEMEETTTANPYGTDRMFKVKDFAFRLVYAKRLTDRLLVGVSLKYIYESIYNAYMSGLAMDIGSNFNTGIYGFVLGMSVNSFGPDVQFHGEGLEKTVDPEVNVSGVMVEKTESFSLPMTFRLGVKNDIIGIGDQSFVKMENQRLTISADAINPIDYTLYYSMGVEYAWNEFAFLRSGTHIGHDTAGMSFGGGVKVGGFYVDYAFADYGLLKDTHQFGLRFAF
jgi:hypothetical protein